MSVARQRFLLNLDICGIHTGVGLFVIFQSTDGIENWTYKDDKIILDGVSITSTELGIGASATVFISNGDHFFKFKAYWQNDNGIASATSIGICDCQPVTLFRIRQSTI